jgi:hypothetical protein
MDPRLCYKLWNPRTFSIDSAIHIKLSTTGTLNCKLLIRKCFWEVFVCLFVRLDSHEEFFSYLATFTITCDRAANLDLCLALTAFSSEGSFKCRTYCDTGPPFLRSYSKDPWFALLNAVLLAKEQSLPILNVLGLTRPARTRLELTTSRMLSETTTTRLLQPVFEKCDV